MALLPAASENSAVQAILVASTTYYLSLHTASPGTTGANEVTGGSYARQAITFGTASGGVATSTDGQTFSSMPAESGGVPYFGLWTAVTGGTYIGGGTTSGLSGAISSGTTISFATGAVTAAIS